MASPSLLLYQCRPTVDATQKKGLTRAGLLMEVARHTDGATPGTYRWTVSTVPMRAVPEGLPYLIGRPLPGEAR